MPSITLLPYASSLLAVVVALPPLFRLERLAPQRPVRLDKFSAELNRRSRVCLRMSEACLPSEDISWKMKSTPMRIVKHQTVEVSTSGVYAGQPTTS